MASIQDPPPFAEAPFCHVCKSAFTTFKRRHHCRACGSSVCADHSAHSMTLPKFGLNFYVRLCDKCYAEVTRSDRKEGTAESKNKANVAASEAKDVSESKRTVQVNPVSEPDLDLGFDCTCSMPLCICEKPVKNDKVEVVWNGSTVAPVTVREKPPLKHSVSENVPKKSPPKQSLFFSTGWDTTPRQQSYEATGEGLREAVKNGDSEAVKLLISKGVGSQYIDKQGMSLLHVAAVFNRKEISFLLLDAGADPHLQNAQGETALDCAQASLANQIREKLQR